MLTGNYQLLYQQLISSIDSKRIFHDPLHTLAFGTDASFYRLIPKMVIKAKNEDEVSLILKESSKLDIPVTFRAAGTSLSGQAISDSVLVIAGNHWKNFKIDEDGLKIRLQPGLTGAKVNFLLAPYGRKIGPDPASINAAMIGGIAANNASGMCCGTAENSYKTLDTMRIILADGSALDTASEESKEQFRQTHTQLIQEIQEMVAEVKANEELSARIARKFKMKNTTGYSLNALVDFSDPFEVIQHLMIGSEGTLGFIAEITYKTVVEHPFRASSLMIFPDIEKACSAVSLLKSAPVAAVELMDRAGLRSVQNQDGMPAYLKTLSPTACAILVETRATKDEQLNIQIAEILQTVKSVPFEIPIQFTDDPKECALFWKIRKGLFPSVGAMRRTGTTVIIEDVAFPVPRLAEATLDLQRLFEKWEYHEAVIFGHALEGNLHFVFTQDFGTPSEIERYSRFMADVSEMVVYKYDGSLKAEHGTGRNIAPFVEMEWGREAYDIMKRIKKIFDPKNLLNPGVILNNDPEVHLKNLKPIPAASETIDKCTECGFCEPTCVSSELTLTPRQRIVVYREMASLAKSGHEPHIAASLAKAYRYSGNETCATDGLCATACPVKIDTGKLIKTLRTEEIGGSQKRAVWVANRMARTTIAVRIALSTVGFFHAILGTPVMKSLSGGMRKLSRNRIPLWNEYMPLGAKKIRTNQSLKSANKVVYFPSCINRAMGVSHEHRNEKQLSEKMQELLNKGGFEVIYPENLNTLCCGMAFSSKGYTEAGQKKSNELVAALLKASEDGKYPVLCDMSPCLYTMKENMQSGLKLYEPVEFILDYLLPNLEITPLQETITVFPVCSMKKMGMEDKLVELAEKCAAKVIVPKTNCCGFAGDRGFSFPELNKHGLSELKMQLPAEVKQGYSTSRTCEIGLSLHSGVSHQSIVYLVDRVSSAKKQDM
ncbi:MAG: FAD-binding and (Fe-S)-binding domain-containing protein [Bacteroidota bacterium]|nr:4Fe-4S ferredoxin [Odoribacter sp.]MDP3644166.1 FAD-binding and (Fe-S)-binding domain-containing protein [Bacteroidota bacterium]